MRRNCNLEPRLVAPSSSLHSADYDHHLQPTLDLFCGSPKERRQQQLTIFYNGRLSICDVTELQATAIIMLANREMEEKLKTPSPLLQSQLCGPTNSLSMKRSLQRFLHKRKYRIQAASPYNH